MRFDRHLPLDLCASNLRPEIDWLLASLGAFLGDPKPEADSRGAAEVEPGRLVELARLNKATVFLDTALLPPSLVAVVASARLRIAAKNLAALTLAREAEALLTAQGIRPLHLKGPLQQIDLYGSPSLRPVGDIDLLVHKRDREMAAATLMAAGFAPHERQLSSWWTRFLGEAHFRRPPGSVIDLHHRLDQPGISPVRNLGALIEGARKQTWRDADFLVPSRLDQLLVAAIGVVKAMFAEEPCAGHLLDLRVMLDRLDIEERAALCDRADQVGLASVLALATQALDTAFGRADRRWTESPGPLLELSREDWRTMLIAPWALGLTRPRRRAILWALSAGSPLAFAKQAGWMQLSETYRAALSRWSGKALESS